LEHLLPYLVWRHKEAYADCFYWNILSFHCHLSKLPFYFLFHPCDELFNVRLVESELRVFFALVQICNRMVMEPNLKEVHKDLSTGCIRFKKLISLSFPLFLKFVWDFFHENWVLVESILIFLILKKGKIGVIKYLILLFIDEVVSSFLSGKGFSSASILFVLHLWRFCFLI
jgi:hypothetical protein